MKLLVTICILATLSTLPPARLHNLMYKTQYIAPLRVKLDPARSDDATINYLSQPDRLTIEWRNVRVAKPYEHPNGGNFTFQGGTIQN